VRQIFPVAGTELAVTPTVTAGPAPPAIDDLAVLYRNGPASATADRPLVRANMVASADGGASVGGRSGPLGGPADRMVFGVLRSLADVIVVGAGTARTERYRPVRESEVWAGLRDGRPPTPAIAVVTRSLDLDSCSRLLTDAPAFARTIVLTTSDAPKQRRSALAGSATVLDVGRSAVDPARAISALADLGCRQILTEGGPHLLGQFISAGVLDELCLTISPVLAGPEPGRIVAGPGLQEPSQLHLAHVLADDGTLLCKYVRAQTRH
jgi:riboflavin biosynthesis pyrimidine reductase